MEIAFEPVDQSPITRMNDQRAPVGVRHDDAATRTDDPHSFTQKSQHVARVLKHALDTQVRTLEPTEEAEAAWVQKIIDLSLMREAFLRECTPGYYNNEGAPERIAKQNGSYGAGPVAFVKVLEAWRSEGGLEGLELTQ